MGGLRLDNQEICVNEEDEPECRQDCGKNFICDTVEGKDC